MKIGLMGAGAIGQYLLKHINGNRENHMTVKSVFVRNIEKYKHLEETFHVKLFTDIHEFLESDIDIVVEATNIETVEQYFHTIIKEKNMMSISIGAFSDDTLLKIAQESDSHKLYLPSGGIGGLDLIQNARALGNIDTLTLTTRKPASSLTEEVLSEETIIFEGSAKDAIAKYPKNMNISIILSVAGIGTENTKVVLVADPTIDKNIHNIEVSGEFGQASFTFVNDPLKENPKTSALAALSIYATLERLEDNIVIG
ncbi:aspartate dehydrogenase [Phocicoccus pinnipedialis]|uniref:L-aspartate dehydrogenase n=1 Tax=Phocicoccus pinnipedialis TaxID=110845 RepID=A0A6V7R603_9BACL|nr:aspartate dehydrogenase [Jeotgalicoccus pinnipedialis]MBP1939690.1 aspartate dehydrogenase [Jeotgalicoccus pinnipedialis]CAD2072312.1 L-aspartate dehydrogenase [Jeotgalicoccus pinnipedialis]